MKTSRRVAVAAFALAMIAAVSALAADVTGKWKASMEGPDGSTMELEFKLKAEGEKLTGAVSGPMGEMPITEGTIKGAEIFFVVSPNADFKVAHKGTVTGDEMKLTVEMGDRQTPMTAKRVK